MTGSEASKEVLAPPACSARQAALACSRGGLNHSIPFLSQCRGTLAPALHNRESLQPSVEADGQLAQGGIKRRTELSEPPGMPYHSAVPLALELGMATLVGLCLSFIMGPISPTKRWHRHRSLTMPLAATQEP